MRILIYFSEPVQEVEIDVPAASAQFDLEQATIDVLNSNGLQVKYLDTITDEDRLEHYKLMAVRAKMHVTDSCA